MHKLTRLLVCFLGPLSNFILCNNIWAQTDSLKTPKDSLKEIPFYTNVRSPDSTLASFIINFEDDFNFHVFKMETPSTIDSLKKGLISDFHKNEMFKIKEVMRLKHYRGDSTLKALVHTPIPDFDAPDTMGLIHRPAKYRGRVLFLHFFNFWDSSFDNEIPILNNLLKKYHEKGLDVLSFMDIPITENEKKVLTQFPIDFPLVANARSFMNQFLPVQKSTPYLVLVDKAGNFRYFYLKNGYKTFKSRDKVKTTLEEEKALLEREKVLKYADWEGKIVQLLEESKF
jgi:peroxiredoxin